MILYVIIGTFGAFGLLSALWILLGCHMAGFDEGTLVLQVATAQAEAATRRLLWLRNMAFAPARLIIVAQFSSLHQLQLSQQYPKVEFLTPEQYLLRLEQERKNVDGS